MRGSRKFCQRGSNPDNFFLMKRERIRNSTKCKRGLSMARQRNTILMVFRWRADDGPTLNAGLVAL